MPSPFPGMDPYLESPGLWPDVHTRLMTEIGDRLSAQLAPRYFVGVEQRVYLLDETDAARESYVPDAIILRPRRDRARRPAAPGLRLEAAKVLTLPGPIEVRETRLVVRLAGPQGRVVRRSSS